MAKLNPTDRTVKQLYGVSLGRCGNPDCPTPDLYKYNKNETELSHQGKIAHIISPQDEGPRSHKDMSIGLLPTSTKKRDEYLRHFNNLIVLCPGCHDCVDDPALEEDYPVNLIREWKELTVENYRKARRNERRSKVWRPGPHIELWGDTVVMQLGKNRHAILPMPYFKVDGVTYPFSDKEWEHWQKARWAANILRDVDSRISSAADTIEMMQKIQNSGLENSNHLKSLVESKHLPTKVPATLLAGLGSEEDPSYIMTALHLLHDSPFTIKEWEFFLLAN